ncbi:FkbM family methyltransferase [Hyphomicrobium facile]|uniref:Methyltransferase, FkbM family n=1 Tax=Hyphomicrobium facile TaxID=51670 RepID=A0A1I7NHU6_9HYPH|nr:FkbM family methyltransferase [Hyphomicrobium facile]SFV34232.1 methyltransferase, FkbM family [Hyphomicrobium facile]
MNDCRSNPVARASLAHHRFLSANKDFDVFHDNADDHIFLTISKTGEFYEIELLRALSKLLREDDLVLDVGANIGNHALFFAGVVGCRVKCFEPNPEAVKLLRHNILANGLGGRIDVLPVAVGPEDRHFSADTSSTRNNLGAFRIRPAQEGAIRAVPLDKVDVGGPVKLVKIDVEGMELDVLLGAREIIRRDRPVVCVECDDVESFRIIFDYLAEFKYIVTGSHNYTATHIFVPVEIASYTEIAALCCNLATRYISTGHEIHRSQRQLRDIAAAQASAAAAHEQLLGRIERLESRLALPVATEAPEIDRLRDEVSALAELLPAAAKYDDLARETETLRFQVADLAQANGIFSSEFAAQHSFWNREMQRFSQRLDDQIASQTAAATTQKELVNQVEASIASETAAWNREMQRFSQRLDDQIASQTVAATAQKELVDLVEASIATETAALRDRYEGLRAAVTGLDNTARHHFAEQRAWTKAIEAHAASIKKLEMQLQGLSALASKPDEVRPERRLKRLRRKLIREAVRPFKRDHRKRLYTKISREIMRPLSLEHWQRRRFKLGQKLPPLLSKMNSGGPRSEVRSGRLLKRLRSLSAVQWSVLRSPASALAMVPPTAAPVPSTHIPPVIDGRRKDGWITSMPGKNAGNVIGQFEVERGGLVRVAIEIEVLASQPLILTLLDGDARVLGPVEVLREGKNEILAFAPLRTRAISARLAVQDTRNTATWRVNSITLEHLDSDAVFLEQKAAGLPVTFASLASLPSRRDMLADCVASLLHQSDKIRVFLNGYDTVPDFLKHERIEVRRSQDWDDRGDAGKFFWLDAVENDGYRLVVDDDLIYPPDFARVLTTRVAKQNNRVLVGLHGVLIRQPMRSYHEQTSRARTFHFAHALAEERTVHILGTGVLCFHSSAVKMRSADFLYCNSADIWLALYAQRHRIPMITPARPQHWVRENTCDVQTETIYAHSLKKSGSRFDSSLVQNATIRRAQPLTVQRGLLPKLCMIAVVQNADELNEFAKKWQQTLSLRYDWVLVVQPASNCEELASAAQALAVEHEIHVLPASEKFASALEAAAAFVRSISPDYVFVAQNDLCFAGAGWDSDIIASLSRYPGGAGFLAVGADTGGGPGNQKIACIGYNAECTATLAGLRSFAKQGSRLFAEGISSNGESTSGLPKLAGMNAQWVHCNDASTLAVDTKPEVKTVEHKTLNDLFDRIVYINLDRRSDRRASIEAELAFHGIRAERFAAIDGNDPAVRAEYEAYVKQPLRTVSEEVRTLRYEQDFYLHYQSQASRVARLEQKHGAKAIRSAGAWAYLRGWEQILERAIQDGIETLLVFDDDVLLHRGTKDIFGRLIEELPSDWLVLQLGTLQYNWNEPWVAWRSPTLYSSCGAVGSHAVGLRFEAMVYLLDRLKMMEMPFDIGALSAITRDFSTRCFVTFPNLAIQSLTDTDIGTSAFQKDRSIDEIAKVHRWNMKDYAPEYVVRVRREMSDAQLVKIRNSESARDSSVPSLVCVLKNEILTIRAFVQHYRAAGIQHFIFIDNGSEDGTFEFLREQHDVELYQAPGPFDWRRKQGWINRVIEDAGPEGAWILYADADELMIFDGIGPKNFGDLARQMDLQGIRRCRGMLIDMYPAGPVLENTSSVEGELWTHSPYFDAGTYKEAKYPEIISQKGGPRKRAFGHIDVNFNPELTKYPLFKMSASELFANPHYLWPYEQNFVSDCYIGILHFKFLPGVTDRIKTAVREKSYWNDSIEYHCYLSAFEKDPKLTLHSEVSREFSGSQSLVEAGLIKPIVWSD